MAELIFILQEPVTVQQSANWTSVVMAFVVALPSTVAAIGGVMALLQSRHNAVVAAATDKKVDDVKKDSGVIIEKAVEIHTLTNSNLQKVTAQLEAANVRIAGFAETQAQSSKKIERLESMLEKLAQHVVPAPTVLVDDPLPVHDAEAGEKLDQLISKTKK